MSSDAPVDDALADEGGAGDAPGDAGTDARPCAYTEYDEGDAPEDVPATGAGASGVERRVWDGLYEVDDPEMPVSVVDLGLIYGVDVEDGEATVDMTLTYTGCPARDMLLGEVESAAANAEGVEDASVRLVWSPEWSVEMVTPEGRERLREFGLSL
jgi:metal-sulfur cluster biosynthetic enzyme